MKPKNKVNMSMIKFGREWEVVENYTRTEFDWLVMTINELNCFFFMNNVDGYIIMKTFDGKIYKSII